MNLREVVVMGWNKLPNKPDTLSLGIVNNTQKYVGNIAVGASFEIDEVLEEYEQTVSYLGKIALNEPDYTQDTLTATLQLSMQKDAAGFGIIQFEETNGLLNRLDTLERMIDIDNTNL